MAEAPAAQANATEPKKTILNRSTAGRVHVLQDGRHLKPGESAEVGLKEFEKIMSVGYKDLADADKVVPQAADRLKKALEENAQLREQVAGLEAELKELKTKGGEPDPTPEEVEEAGAGDSKDKKKRR